MTGLLEIYGAIESRFPWASLRAAAQGAKLIAAGNLIEGS